MVLVMPRNVTTSRTIFLAQTVFLGCKQTDKLEVRVEIIRSVSVGKIAPRDMMDQSMLEISMKIGHAGTIYCIKIEKLAEILDGGCGCVARRKAAQVKNK